MDGDDRQHSSSTIEALQRHGLPVDRSADTDDPRKPALWATDDAWTESAIPPRPWIANGYLMRGAITVLVGAPSAGKSSLMLALAAALALGVEFGRFSPRKAFNVGVMNVEDDRDEQRRRLSGVLRSLGRRPADLTDRLILIGPTSVGTLLIRDPISGKVQPTRAMNELAVYIEECALDVLILDPLIELHTAEENDNTGLRAIMASLRALAARHDIAIVLLHHTRKGVLVAGDPDSSRGASSIIGAARIVLTVTGMQPEEAAAFGLREDQRRHYIRLDGAKSNYAPLEQAEWYQRTSFVLDNDDAVAVVDPWSPPADVVGPETRIAIESALAIGVDGSPYSQRLSNEARSIRQLLAAHGIGTATGQRQLLQELRAAGYEDRPFKRANRGIAYGIRTPAGLPSAHWVEGEGEP